jgi:hypothetical protein
MLKDVTMTLLNPIVHVWDFTGRKINQCNPKCPNIDELRTAILQEELSEQPLAVKKVVQFGLYVA